MPNALLFVQGDPPEIGGVHLVGLTPTTGRKILLTIALVAAVAILLVVLRALIRPRARRQAVSQVRFWSEQGVSLLALVIVVLGLASIWFETPAQLTGILGVLAAGVAIALQRVITSFAAYLILLRGRVFTVGDRIVMGGVRGDVVALGFMQTTIMEMGEPPPQSDDSPGRWVMGRQYTGRIVRVTNDKIFDSPVYNYTREFPYLWEELRIPIGYKDDRARAEQILLDAARRHTQRIQELSAEALDALLRRYWLKEPTDLEPRVFWRLTDNWIEMSLRFIAEETGVRGLKDRMSRDILDAFDKAGIQVASATFEIIGLPPLRVIPETPPQ